MTKRKKKYSRVIGIDLGNGMVKIRSVDKKGNPYKLVLPCAWSYLKDVGDALNSAELKLDTYYIDDVAYVWGEDISELGNKVKVAYGHENRYKSDIYIIMAKIALARVVRDLEIQSNENIYLVTGVPSGETNTDREEQIVDVFKGIHEVDIEDEELVIKVGHVEIMSQPVATVIDRYLDDEGYVADEEYETMKVAVIDIGGGTTDLDIVDRLKRQKGYRSVPKGFTDVYNAIREVIHTEYPSHNVTDYQLLKCLDSNVYKPSKRSKEVDFTNGKEVGIREVIVDIQQAIMSHWKDHVDLDEILLIGASAKEFEERLSNVVTGLTIPSNHNISGVEGMFKWGMLKVGEMNESDALQTSD